MDTIRLSRENLLGVLEENRAKHHDEYTSARVKWVEESTIALRRAADKAANEGVIDTNPLADLPKPVTYLESYDDAIAKVRADVRKELELDNQEFAAWYLDKWNWRGAFAANTSLYNGPR